MKKLHHFRQQRSNVLWILFIVILLIFNNHSLNAQIANAGSDQNVCSTSATLNSLNFPNTGVWILVSGSGVIQNSSGHITLVSNLSPGENIFRWTLDVNSSFDDISIFNDTPTTANAGSDFGTCTDSTQFSGNLPSFGTGTWTLFAGAGNIQNSLLYNSKVNGLNNGVNTFRWTIKINTCTSIDEVAITRSSVSSNAGKDSAFCLTNNYNLVAANPNPAAGEWHIVSGAGVFDQSTAFSTTVRNLNFGLNKVRWQVSRNGCVINDTVNLTNNNFAVNAGADVNVCSVTVPLNATNPSIYSGSGYWTCIAGTGIFSNSTLYNSNVSGFTSGLNQIRWTINALGCTNNDVMLITNGSPSAAVVAADDTVCTNMAFLTANQPAIGSGKWSITLGSGNIIVESTNNTTVNSLGVGLNKFEWKITDYGCFTYDTISILNNTIVSNAGIDQVICHDSTIMEGNDPSPNGSGYWTVLSGQASVVQSNAYNSKLRNIGSSGDRTTVFRWTIQNISCTSVNDVSIVNNMVVADAGCDSAICANELKLYAIEPLSGESGIWTITSGSISLDNNSIYNTTARNIAIGYNSLRWIVTGSSSCKDSSDIVISNNTVTAMAGTDLVFCTDTGKLEAFHPASAYGIWSISSGNLIFQNSTLYNTKVTNINPGANTLNWTVIKGSCSSSDDILVYNHKVFANAGSDVPVCNGYATLIGNNPNPSAGVWTLEGGIGSIQSASNYTTNVTGLGSGTNTFRWTVSNGFCTIYDDVNIINNYFSVNAGIDRTICEQTTNLEGSQPPLGGGGVWTFESGAGQLSASTLYNSSVSNLGFGSNSLKWTVTHNGCTFSDLVNLTSIRPNANAGADQVICFNNTTVEAITSTPGTGVWSVSSGIGVTIISSFAALSTIQNIPAGNSVLRWSVTYSGCTAEDDIQIKNSMTSTHAGSNQEICINSGTLNAQEPAVNHNGYWLINAGSMTIVNSTMHNSAFINTGQGLNSLQWNVVNTDLCTAFDDVIITNNQTTIASAGSDQTLCTNSIGLNANNPSSGYGNWTVISGGATFVNSTQYNTSAQFIPDVTTTLRWTINKGICSAIDEVNYTNSTVLALAGAYITTCSSNSTLNAIIPPTNASGTWTVIGGSATINQTTSYNSTLSLLANGNNTLKWTLTRGTCSSFDQVVVTNNSTSVSYAGEDKDICTSNSTIMATNPLYGSGIWTNPGNSAIISNSTSYYTNVSELAEGINKFAWLITLGSCLSSDTVLINNRTITAFAGNDQTLCNSSTNMSAIQAPTGATGYWTIEGGFAIIQNSTLCNTSLTSLNRGTNNFKWSVSNGVCSAEDMVNISNYMPSTPNAGADKTICSTQTNLSGSIPTYGTGSWSLASGSGAFSSTTSYSTTVSGLNIGVNTIRWTISYTSCTLFDDMNVTNASVEATAGADATLCIDSVQLNGGQAGGSTFTWTKNLGNLSTIVSPNSLSTKVRNLAFGQNRYYLTVAGTSCTDKDTIDVYYHKIVANAGIDQNVCGSSANLLGNNPLPGFGNWTISGGSATINSSTLYNSPVSNLPYGTSTFTWTIQYSICTTEDSALITRSDVITNAGPNRDVCNNYFTLEATNPAPFGNGVWSVFSGSAIIASSTSYNTTVSNLAGGETIFRWSVSSVGCNNYDEVTIKNIGFNVNAGSDQINCSPSATLSGEDPATGSGLWTKISGSGTIESSTYKNSAVSGISPGTSVFRWSITKSSCTSYDEVNVTNGLIQANAGLDGYSCSGSYSLQASPAGQFSSGEWTVEDGTGIFSQISSHNTFVHSLSEGANTLRWTLTTGICSTTDDVIINYTSVAVNAGPHQNLCQFTTNLSGNTPTQGSGVWSISQGSGKILNSLSSNTSVSELGYGENKFVWKISTVNCYNMDTVKISNYAFTADAGIDIQTEDNTASMHAILPNGASGSWILLSGNGSIVNSTLPSTSISDLKIGSNIFRWQVLHNGCTSLDDVAIKYSAWYCCPQADIHGCSDYNSISIIPKGINGVWTSNVGSVSFDCNTCHNTIIRNLAKESNALVRWTETISGGDDYVEFMVFNDGFDISAGNDIETSSSSFAFQAPNPGSVTNSLWTVIEGSSNIINVNAYNSVVTDLTEGNNKFIWEVEKNLCTDKDTVVVNYKPNGVDDLKFNKLELFPNPTRDGYFQLSGYNFSKENFILKITDVMGKEVVFDQYYSENNCMIYLPYKSGSYIVTISNSKEIYYQILVIY